MALGHLGLVVVGMVAVLSFLLGAMFCAILVDFARRKAMASEYALPLLLEAGLILCFGLLGARLATYEGVAPALHGVSAVLHHGPAERSCN